MVTEIMRARQRQVLYDIKWKKFLRRAWLLRCIPFVEFALASGSMATGNVGPASDFDVLIGARAGRIFTTRFFWRRTRLDRHEAAADKVCLNHFVTRSAYCLKPPYSDAWRAMYRNLVPVFGKTDAVNAFWESNSGWMGERTRYAEDARHIGERQNIIGRGFAWVLSGVLGNVLERALRFLQMKKIERSMRSVPADYRPRIIVSDVELEFHPDQRKFEQ
ncbi:MAG: hypothetical protein HYV25_00635 [Candidatus Harrisonbacteria bacterium]|nr:hypothetical protein [Candidatus Harrisonbacteria bacterium]